MAQQPVVGATSPSQPASAAASSASFTNPQGSAPARQADTAAANVQAPAVAASGERRPAATLKLPPNCEAVQPQAGTSVIICAAAREGLAEKFLTPSVGLSVLALLVGLWNFRYTIGKDARARQQSIQDDYWLRKVVSPVSIEPFLKFGTELLSKLPTEQSNPEQAEAFGKERLTELRGLAASFIPLRLLSADVHSSVAAALDEFEDRLATYMGDLDAFFKQRRPEAPSRPEAVTELSSRLLAVLDPIRKHQAALGFDAPPK
jgi:hypothetical protein